MASPPMRTSEGENCWGEKVVNGRKRCQGRPWPPSLEELKHKISVLRKDSVFKCFVCEKEVTAHLGSRAYLLYLASTQRGALS